MAIVCAVLATVTGVIAPATAWPPEATGSLALAFTQISAWAPWVVGLSLAFLLSNFTLQYGAAHLSAHTTSMVMMSEIAFASVSSVALGASALTWRISAGGGMIVLAALLASQVHTTKDKPS
jgi:drug/metabolite transporter (DMT)-like permease